MNTKKKGLCRKLKCFLPKLGEELGIFRLIIQRSNLDGGYLHLGGGRVPPHYPYNLSRPTAYNVALIFK